MKVLEKQAHHLEGSSDDSSVNDNRHRVGGEIGGRGSNDKEEEQRP